MANKRHSKKTREEKLSVIAQDHSYSKKVKKLSVPAAAKIILERTARNYHFQKRAVAAPPSDPKNIEEMLKLARYQADKLVYSQGWAAWDRCGSAEIFRRALKKLNEKPKTVWTNRHIKESPKKRMQARYLRGCRQDASRASVIHLSNSPIPINNTSSNSPINNISSINDIITEEQMETPAWRAQMKREADEQMSRDAGITFSQRQHTEQEEKQIETTAWRTRMKRRVDLVMMFKTSTCLDDCKDLERYRKIAVHFLKREKELKGREEELNQVEKREMEKDHNVGEYFCIKYMVLKEKLRQNQRNKNKKED